MRLPLRGAISLTPWLQPGDRDWGKENETVSNGFVARAHLETVRNGLGNHQNLNHRAEAAVLMRSLRVPQRSAFLALSVLQKSEQSVSTLTSPVEFQRTLFCVRWLPRIQI
jgi:hypothetical protein